VTGPTTVAQDAIAARIRQLTGRSLSAPPVVVADTSDFMAIDRDHVVDLEGELFLVTLTEREKRFGLVDEPKFWVKRAISLASGRTHILKMVFHERFRACVGANAFICARDAEKEARVLELMRGDPRFMQGRGLRDVRGNLVRVIDFITGEDLLRHLERAGLGHEEYFRTVFPSVFARTMDSLRAIERLHEAGLCHGDIRNDHILLEAGSGRFVWIDFDLNEDTPLFDVWSLGNLLHCVVGNGFVVFRDVVERRPDLAGRLTDDDASVFFTHRVMNLRAVYPYIPAALNDVLLRFSCGARSRYDSTSQVIEDLGACAAVEGWPLGGAG